MFKLKKIHEPFGTPESPQYETSYSEGLIPVVNGLCEVRLPETRDRLVKIGYEEVAEDASESSGMDGPINAEPRSRRINRKKSTRKKKSRR